MKSEHEIQNEIQVTVSMDHHHIFRVNTGSVKTVDGCWFKTGLPNGFPDLCGYRKQNNQMFFVEVKNAHGKPRQDQIHFHQQLMRDDVIHGIARSVKTPIEN